MTSEPFTCNLQRLGPEPPRYLAGQRGSTPADRIIGTVCADGSLAQGQGAKGWTFSDMETTEKTFLWIFFMSLKMILWMELN